MSRQASNNCAVTALEERRALMREIHDLQLMGFTAWTLDYSQLETCPLWQLKYQVKVLQAKLRSAQNINSWTILGRMVFAELQARDAAADGADSAEADVHVTPQ